MAYFPPMASFIASHPILWTLGALAVGYIIGNEATLARWNAERRRLRKKLGMATVEDYRHND